MTLNGVHNDRHGCRNGTLNKTVEVHPHFASASTFGEVKQLISRLCHCGVQKCTHSAHSSDGGEEFKPSTTVFPDPNCSEVTVQNADVDEDNMHCLTRCVTSIIFESDKSQPEAHSLSMTQDIKDGAAEPRCTRTTHLYATCSNQRILCLWDIDDTLVSSNARGERQCPLFDKAELMSLFRSLYGQTRHLLLSQGSIDDVFAGDGSGQLSFLRGFFVSAAPPADHKQHGRRSATTTGLFSRLCSCAASTKCKGNDDSSTISCATGRSYLELENGAVLVRLTAMRETSNSQRDHELMNSFLTSYKPHDPESYHARWIVLRSSVWGITLAPLNTPVPPSEHTIFVDGAVYRKMDVAWSMAMSGNWDKVFFIDNNLYEVGAVRKGVRLPALLYNRNELRLKRLTKAEYILLAVSAALRRLEKIHDGSVTQCLNEKSCATKDVSDVYNRVQQSDQGKCKEDNETGSLSVSPRPSDACNVMNSYMSSKNVSSATTTPETKRRAPVLCAQDCAPLCSQNKEEERDRSCVAVTATTVTSAPSHGANYPSSSSSAVSRSAADRLSTLTQRVNSSSATTTTCTITNTTTTTITNTANIPSTTDTCDRIAATSASATQISTVDINDSHGLSSNGTRSMSLHHDNGAPSSDKTTRACNRTVEFLVVHFRMSAENFRSVLLERAPLPMLSVRHARLSSSSQVSQTVLGPKSGCSDADYASIMASFREQLLFFYALVYSEFQLNGHVDLGRGDRWRPGSHLVFNQMPPKMVRLPYLYSYFRSVCDEIESVLVAPLLNNSFSRKKLNELRSVAYVLYTRLLYNVIFIDPYVTHKIARALFEIHSGEGSIPKKIAKELRISIQEVNSRACPPLNTL